MPVQVGRPPHQKLRRASCILQMQENSTRYGTERRANLETTTLGSCGPNQAKQRKVYSAHLVIGTIPPFGGNLLTFKSSVTGIYRGNDFRLVSSQRALAALNTISLLRSPDRF